MKKLLLALFFGIITSIAIAQPANDDCSTAQNIGSLPLPAACPSGIGNTVTVNGSLVGGTAMNPYTTSIGCTGGAMASPAIDVWYTFTATSNTGLFTVNSSFANPNIAIYPPGTCGNFGPGVGACGVGAGNSVSVTVNQMTVGATYFIQVSSNDLFTTGTFTLVAQNNTNCAACLTESSLTANPLPVNGAYQPGQVVDFCYTISEYMQTNTNWMHGVQVNFGSGWAGISNQTAPTPVAGSGTWAWYNSVTSSPPPNGSGQTFGQGFYIDLDGDGNPGNNFGDDCVQDGMGGNDLPCLAGITWTFCFRLTVASACNPGSDLSVLINTSGDGESGGWQDLGCQNDEAFAFLAQGSCCPPTMLSTAETCVTNDGTATATPVGANGPYNYSWAGPAGYTNNANGVVGAHTITGLNSGTYTVTITDASFCAITNTVTVADNSVIPPAPTTAPIAYCINATAAALTATPSAGGTLNWYGTNAVGGTASATAPTPSTSAVGATTYYVSQSVGGCEGPRAPLVVTINALPTPTANNTGPYCLNETINLTSSGGTGYAWTGPNAFVNATQNPTIATATLAMAGNYIVTVTNANGCVATATTTVVVNPLPTPAANNDGAYCENGTINLTATGGTGYAWTGPNAFVNATQNPSITSATLAMAGNYIVTVTDANGCTATANTTVVINALPVAPTTAPISYCLNATAIPLMATATGTLNWYGTNAAGGTASLTAPTPSTATAGLTTFYVSQTITGCEGPRAPLAVTINPLPTPTANNTGPYCANATINLTAGGGTTYAWTGPNAFVNATQNPSITTATLAMAGNYIVTVTDANNCVATATTTVVVNPLPAPTANNDGAYCANETINLTATGGTSYAWTGPNAFASANQNPTIPNSTIAMNGIYTVVVTDANGCIANATTNVVVNPLPVAVVANTGPYCANQNISLTCDLTGVSYAWTGPDSYVSGFQNPSIINSTITNAGNYILTVTDANLCQSSYTTTVVVNPLPIVAISSNSPVCENGTILLTSGGGNLYSWSGPLPINFSSNLQNPSITGATLTMAGNYTVTVTDANGCINANVTNVQITPLPIAPTTIPIEYCLNATTIPLTATGSGTLNWYGTNAIGGIADPNAPTPTSILAGLTTYYVSQTVSNCEGPRAPLDVTIHPLPSANINAINPGCAPICRDFFLSSTDNITAYTWDLGNGIFTGNDTVLQHCYSDAGVYNVNVTVTDLNGCSDIINFNNWVTVYEVPIAEFSFGPDKVSVLEPEINFVDMSLGTNIVSYTWLFGDPLSSSSGSVNPTFTYTDIGIYNVTHIVMNDKGCIDTIIHPVTIPQDWAIYVPNAFSPNDDGINDMFHPSGIGLDEKTYNLWIFDRWGNMIFYTKDWNTYWDGKVQGHSNIVQEDTYIWKINVRSFNGKKFFDTGHVHVVR